MAEKPIELNSSAEPRISFWRKLSRYSYALAAAVYLIFNGLRFMLIHDFNEWTNVFVLAAQHLRAGIDIYIVTAQAQNHAYSYPPFMALLAIPFTFISAQISLFIWFLINAGCAIITWKLAWRLCGGERLTPSPGTPDFGELSRTGEGRGEGDFERKTAPAKQTGARPFIGPSENLICILGLLCGMRFMQDNFEHRQTDLVIAVLTLFGCYAWQNARDLPAATFWGLAAAMKGPPLLFAPYLVWRGRWLAAIWMVLLAVGVNLLPDLVSHPPHGIWLTQWYEQMIKPLGQVGDWHSDIINNQSIAGAARRYFATTWSLGSDPAPFRDVPLIGAVNLKRLVYLLELTLLAISAWVMGRPGRMYPDSDRRPTPAMLECSIVITLMLLLSPMSSKPHFCVLLLPAFCLARRAVAGKDKIALAAVVVCTILVLVLDRNLLGKSWGNVVMWFGAVTWGTAALWGAGLVSLGRTERGKGCESVKGSMGLARFKLDKDDRDKDGAKSFRGA